MNEDWIPRATIQELDLEWKLDVAIAAKFKLENEELKARKSRQRFYVNVLIDSW